MELKDWINIIAIVLSPIVAVLITMWLTTRNEKQIGRASCRERV